MSSAKSSSSSASNSISSLNAAAARWSLSSTDLPLWRARMVASQSTPAPAPVAQQSHVPKGADPKSRQQFLDELKLKQMAAEERLARLRSGEADDDDDEEEEEQAAAAAEERGDQKHAEEDDAEEDGEEDSSEDEEEEAEDEAEYENELEYYVHELLCVDAINHDPPTGKEEKCPYCVDGKKFESEFACSTCAFVRGVCASCRRIVVLRQLEDSKKGASICLALLSDPALLARTFELDPAKDADDAEEAEAIREQITFMLDAYFNKD